MALDRTFAAVTGYCEASGEPLDAKRGVIWSMFNRLADGRFGKSITGICLSRKQFSEWNDDAKNNANLLRIAGIVDDDPGLEVFLDLFDQIKNAVVLGNRAADPTNGATHYYDTSVEPPYWTAGAIRTVQLGKLVFYKGVK